MGPLIVVAVLYVLLLAVAVVFLKAGEAQVAMVIAAFSVIPLVATIMLATKVAGF